MVNYLPYPESDFIFAIVGEDFGLLGCVAVIALFVALMIAGFRVAIVCRDKFGALLAAGITASITVQAFLNMGVVVSGAAWIRPRQLWSFPAALR